MKLPLWEFALLIFVLGLGVTLICELVPRMMEDNRLNTQVIVVGVIGIVLVLAFCVLMFVYLIPTFTS
ncbi:hypothetical protein [uncultured Limosilactobacillus sp.]|uniref:hypothetical protein n=1 Tax=uncultured Limosilactobacillus sp. TaxID=2837629 RepID=UPI0025E17A1B|nr:hypothetical protein [uncultured Limosilactobacillus sp.]